MVGCVGVAEDEERCKNNKHPRETLKLHSVADSDHALLVFTSTGITKRQRRTSIERCLLKAAASRDSEVSEGVSKNK